MIHLLFTACHVEKRSIHDTCRRVASLDFYRYPFFFFAFPAGNIDRNYVRDLTYPKAES